VSVYEYIESQKSEPTNLNPVVKMWLRLAVSTSGFHHWATRPQSATSDRREALIARIQHFFEESDGTYGYRRIHADLAADLSGRKFVGDITYLRTWQGFIYLATVIDCYSGKVVGWSIAHHMRTELVADALENAAATTQIEPGAIWHSNRGGVYTSTDFGALVTSLGMRPSMGRGRVLAQQHGRIFPLDAEERAGVPNRLRD
jgi:putative transposase